MPLMPKLSTQFLADRRGNRIAHARALASGKAVTARVASLPVYLKQTRDLTQSVSNPNAPGVRFSTYQPQGVLFRSGITKPRIVVRQPNKTERQLDALKSAPAHIVSTSAPSELRPAVQPVGAAVTTSPIFWTIAGVVVFVWALKGGKRP